MFNDSVNNRVNMVLIIANVLKISLLALVKRTPI